MQTVKGAVTKPLRCAIYTRKSTEHNLDLAFNSLDAQREACEAYIKSQAHEGWRLLPAPFDDGGLSGASLDRPALQRLLGEVRLRKIDVIVVYKVDRLTRSLADFAKLVEAFDEHGVSFVSVTQSFNTTSSMGRLTLNVLLSFAQFEREVIGERVRDKIAASKRKGLWVGGPVPIGYRSAHKKLSVVEAEAEFVRTVFRRYLAMGSIGLLIDDLHRSGIKPRPRQGRDGTLVEPAHFTLGPLAHILKNRFYIGEVVYRGEIYPGEQEPIIERGLFLAVQAKLKDGAVHRRVRRSASPSFLSGLLFDDRGHAMSSSHANKKGVRYRYYVSQALLQNRKEVAGSIARIGAPDIELMVVAAIRHRVASEASASALWIDQEEASAALDLNNRDLVSRHVERIVLRPKFIELKLCAGPADQETANESPSAPAIILQLPWAPTSARSCKGISRQPSASPGLDPDASEALLSAISRAQKWINDLLEQRVDSFESIARSENKVVRHVQFLAPLAFVSPRVVEAIANGTAPDNLTVTSLARALPHAWAEQERKFAIV